MMKTFKILGLLLSYPDTRLVAMLNECAAFLQNEKWIDARGMKKILELISWMQGQDTLDLQETYVGLFDRTPSLSLHLFEHVHGDSRERGQALVDLSNLYREKGLIIAADEMPDYLPLFFEYLSVLSLEEAKEGLESIASIIAPLGARLTRRESLYAGVIDAALSTAGRVPGTDAIAQALARSDGRAPDFDEMDKAWEEQFALAAPDLNATQDCPKASAMMQRMAYTAEKTR